MASGLIKPNKLKKGDTIGVFAPSSWIDPSQLARATEELRRVGFNVFVHPQALLRDRCSAGTTEQKLAALHELFSDSVIQAIFPVRGGVYALHMLDGIDYELIRNHPKILTGFSDVTVLHCALHARAGLVTFHSQGANKFDPEHERACTGETLKLLTGNWVDPLWPINHPIDVIRPGDVSGALWGGNLSMLAAALLSGEKYTPDFDGKILVVEEVGEEIRQVDRILGALRVRGVFDRLAGIIFGQMTEITDTGDTCKFECSVRDVICEHTARMKGPVILNAPIGHEHPNIPFPVGIRARLTAETNGGAQLQLLESPFADA